ncbi:MAG: DUF3662 domain-containing protein [Pyrinomonadaceae bacterium]|nr:DUF3662 domain-containing protein [Pyrinomonadaceae bacterium]
MSVLEKVRRWIDGESAELVLEKAARDAQVKPRSSAEEFIVKIAKAVEEVMEREMVPLPQGTTIIPTEYIIFLGEKDDSEWQGAKRRGLEQGLYHVLAERAKEIAGKKKLETKSFAVELRVDGTLEEGEVRVQHGWEETSSGKTSVLSRKGGGITPKLDNPVPPQAPPPNFTSQPPAAPVQSQNPPSTPVAGANPPEELTAVSPRKQTLFFLEVWRSGIRQNVLPVYKNETVVGRGSKSKPVDIALPGDPEVSRRHLVVYLDQLGNYSVVNEGRNPAMINNAELPIGQAVSVTPGQPIMVCSYMLRIQP